MGMFIPSPRFDREVQQATRPELLIVAEKIAQVAARTVNTDSAAYASESLRVTVDSRGVVTETLDYAGHIIEWGSVNQAPQAPLRTGAASSGRFEPA